MVDDVELGRLAFERRAWREACARLGAVSGLVAEDLERLAVAAYLAGDDEASARAWEGARTAFVAGDEPARAATCGFWLGLARLFRGEVAPAQGWFARAARDVEAAGSDCSARGLLLLPRFLEALDDDADAAVVLAEQIVAIAHRCGDPDLLALGLLGRGQAALASGRMRDGMRLFDEVMVSVTTGEVSPIPAGIVYCGVIEACMDAFDVRRASEWTDALHEWCASQPDLVPYQGQCLVHRSQVFQARGAWAEAVVEAEQARRRLAEPPHPALGAALYQQGELHRLRGEFDAAEAAYRRASAYGHEPAPGFALLRAAQGRLAAASTAVRRMLEESSDRLSRAGILAAAVEILLAEERLDAAHAASEELTALAAARQLPLLDAVAWYATGCVLLAEHAPQAALRALRDAARRWRELSMPFEEARARVHIARACRALGDADAAALELDVAIAVFERVGARPDLARATQLTGAGGAAGALTGRECEVLRLLAAGKSNRSIASDLTISEHTVARHVQNIFTKLGLSSRAAATAYAYEHHLI